MSRMIRQGAIVLLSVGAAAGCATGSNHAAGAQTVMVSAVNRSQAASTFHISATEKLKSVSGTALFSLTGVSLSGDVDLSTSSAHLKATLEGASQPGQADQTTSFEIIQIGGDSWNSTTGLGGLGLTAPPGHWVKDDSSSSQIPDPAKWFAALRSAATNVRFIGTAPIDGAACDEYRLQGTSSLFDALGSSKDQPPVDGPVAIDVWVDRSNLVRRLSSTLEQNMGDPGQVESIALTVDFTDYGEPVKIAPPPAGLVVPNP